MNLRFWASIVGAFATALAGCSPGYMKASELESKHQGPADCEARCVELGMRMGALVLVSDTLPGCVCQPKPVEPPQPTPGATPTPGAPPTPDAAQQGASAATTSYVVVAAAAAAARANQTQQQRQQQQSYLPK